jgi:glutamyl-tRNA synthetase
MRVPDGETIAFTDENLGNLRFVAGVDFGDFLVWRKDGIPSYELAVVADDIAMGITEVVRGEDLLLSTARQLLIYRALGATPPTFYHCPLVRDASGNRLAKRDKAQSLRELRAGGMDPKML